MRNDTVVQQRTWWWWRASQPLTIELTYQPSLMRKRQLLSANLPPVQDLCQVRLGLDAEPEVISGRWLLLLRSGLVVLIRSGKGTNNIGNTNHLDGIDSISVDAIKSVAKMVSNEKVHILKIN